MPPLVAFALGAILMGLNLKNLPLTIGAGLSIADSDLAPPERWLAILAYALLASAAFVAIVAIAFALGHRADGFLERAKALLVRHNHALLTALFFLLGLLSIRSGLASVFS